MSHTADAKKRTSRVSGSLFSEYTRSDGRALSRASFVGVGLLRLLLFVGVVRGVLLHLLVVGRS